MFINPKINYAFKKIFGSSESKDILISFLNALIYDAQPILEDLEIINPNLPPIVQGLKDTYLDVKAKLNDGTLMNIEMQVLNVQSFRQRVLYNATKTYAFQLQAREGYRMLKPVIALTITDFVMFEEFDRSISRFTYKEENLNVKYTDRGLELVFIELPKFTKNASQLETLTEKWIYFLKYARSLTQAPENLDNIPEIHRAFEIANQANLSPEELEDLDRREMFIYDQQGAIALGREEGREAGREEGREAGREEGREQGREEGETNAKRSIARQLLEILDDERISQTTGLSVEDVRNLRGNPAEYS